MNSQYQWTGINSGSLPSHCEKIAQYWSTLVCFDRYASGKAMIGRSKAKAAFKAGLRAGGLPDDAVDQAYADTVAMARLIYEAKGKP